MHKIIFYRDRSGRQPVYDYIKELEKSGSKDSRIKLNKINDYIQSLSEHGTSLNENYVKHIVGDIWELRPIRDRIMFASLINDEYVLLHSFTKKTQKTPAREIEKAKRELDDFIKRSDLNE